MFAQIEITFTTSDYNGYHISCFGAKDGSITANATGGTPPYTYQWSNEQTTATINGLSADFYNLVVTDSAGESADFGINLTAPEILKPILTEYQYNNGYNISLYGVSNGSITTAINGGVSPFTFQWEDGPTTQHRAQLGGGFYVLQVIDANNCASVVQTSLSEPERDDWTMGGNANTNPANNFIGTTDNKDLVIKTNSSERMRIGKTGIITMPSGSHFEKLYVNRISTTDSVIYLGDSSMVVGTLVNQIYSDGTGTYKGIGICGQIPQLRSGNSFAFGLNSISIGNWVNSRGTNSISIGSGGTSFNGTPLPLENYDDNSLFIGFNSTIPTVVVKPAGAQNSTGSVGIATTIVPSGYKLAVNGKIICEEVKVKKYLNWDRVFASDYPLISIAELKEFLIANKHLKSVPSYSEMQKEDGVNVGEMQMSLLRTVEEQALYIIQLNDRLERVEADNKLLKEKLVSGNH